jgi:predicted nucleic acid-binding protein
MEPTAHGKERHHLIAMDSPLVLIDSDAFVGWVFPDDVHHKRASAFFRRIMKQRYRPVTTNWVIQETATVLSRRSGQELAKKFLDKMTSDFPVIHITEQLEQDTIGYFCAQEGRNISMVDCSNVVVMKELGITHIASFDKFYFQKPNIQSI